MSCPDWKSLVRNRVNEASPFGRDAAEWRQALAHFDGGCQSCRRAALAADPLLVFRQLPTTSLQGESEDREIADMQRAVAAMRTASRLESPVRNTVSWRRWAAAAGLAILTLSAGPWRAPSDRPEPTGPSADRPSGFAAAAFEGGDGINTVEAVENRPDARVYQMDDDTITVAMVFSESLDL